MWSNWSKAERIAAASLMIATVACSAALLVVPEVRDFLGLEFTPARQDINRMEEERAKSRAAANPRDGSDPVYKIVLHNLCSGQISVAILYYASDGQWERTGWFTVEPGQSDNPGIEARAPTVYFFAEGSGRTWSGNKDNGVEKSVVNAHFAAADYMRFPDSLSRSVYFFRGADPNSNRNIDQSFSCP